MIKTGAKIRTFSKRAYTWFSEDFTIIGDLFHSATFCIIFRNIAYIILYIHFGRFCIKLKRNALLPDNIVNEI